MGFSIVILPPKAAFAARFAFFWFYYFTSFLFNLQPFFEIFLSIQKTSGKNVKNGDSPGSC
jgi:hypothetical protein